MGDSRLFGPVDMPTQRHVPRLSLNLACFSRVFGIETSGALRNYFWFMVPRHLGDPQRQTARSAFAGKR
jgi:hypothetical protein